MSDPWVSASNTTYKAPQPTLQDTFDWLLQNLDHVDQVGQTEEYQANCPLCNDSGQHLYFRQENDVILMHCHHGCENKFILLKLGLTQADLFQSNGSRPGTPPPAQQVIAEYVYTDEQGQPLHKTVKMGPKKQFFQKHWDGAKWVNGLGSVRRVLYNLMDLDNGKAGDLVYLCEGEKSADAIHSLGPIATTNPMGAGHWRPEYSELLRGRRVVILPDFDDAGLAHMQTVNRELTGKATSVQVLIFPNLKYHPNHGEDPYDWVDRGGTINELYKLTITAPRLQVQSKKATANDYMTALAILGYQFRMNTCTDYIEVNEKQITDVAAATIRTRMRDMGFENVSRFEDAYTADAAKHLYHPVHEYLEGLTWSGQDNIGVLATYFSDERGLFPVFLKRWLIGAIAKAYAAEQNRMLVLDGPQDVGKSHFAQWLCSPLKDLFVEGPINPDNKDDHIRLMRCWLWEVAELGSTTRRADQEALKYFLTMRQVTVRKPYGKFDIVKPALASFIGTVNNEAGILNDPTGSRRFMIVKLESINWDYDKLNVDQIWAQAKALYDVGETWQLRDSEKDLATEANEEYQIEDPLLSYVLGRFDITGDPVDEITTAQMLKELHLDGWRLSSPKAESMALAGLFKTEPQLQGQVGKIANTSTRGYWGLTVRDRIANP